MFGEGTATKENVLMLVAKVWVKKTQTKWGGKYCEQNKKQCENLNLQGNERYIECKRESDREF